MKTIHAIFIYAILVSVYVIARRSHGGHGGGNSSHASHSPYGAHGYHYVSASHAHYSYHPPRHVSYICRYCTRPTTYPVYHNQLPTYVYVYMDSGSRYNHLLTGLALYNLGRTTESGHHNMQYAAQRQEKCSLQIIDRSHFEETDFPCFMISSFIKSSRSNTTRTVDITSPPLKDIKPNVTVAGAPLEVTPAQECVLWHNMTMHKERNHVPCALLEQYSKSVKPAGVPVYVWGPTLLGIIIIIFLCCQCIPQKKKESVKEEAPLNELRVPGYCANY